jgi:hypothetical protein
MRSFIILCLLSVALAQNPPLPAKGDDGYMGGIFGMGPAGLKGVPGGAPKISGFPNGPEFPKPGPRNTNGGSGPYKAEFKASDADGLPKHTVYAPKSPPNVKMPVIVWGNGGCMVG